ncbi:MAG TPA: carbohydrate ABC transporter permease [Anaerolineae bacterium]|nr:carbohydrate ABC transporter permease [Anaerolineae bacterium]HQI83233.1 carbohydrate ABC transporter permease [Anaerolineae bacterium]
MNLEYKRSLSSTIIQIVIYVFLAFWALVVIFPMIWVLVSSFKTDQEIFFSPWTPPAKLMWDNFARAWGKANMGRYLFNTLTVNLPAIFFTLLFSAMAGYVLARYSFPGNRLIFYAFLGGMLFPVMLALVPLFFLLQSMKIIDSHFGLILVYIAYSLPFTVFFMTGFFKTLPTELLEAAIIDGASHYQLFFQIVIPLAQNGLVSMGIFNFLGMWNQYILPLVLLTSSTKYVLSQGLAFLAHQQRYQSDWSGLFAAITIVMLPTLIVYVIFQNQIQRGLTVGALKG